MNTTRAIVHIITRLDKGGSAENVLVTCDRLTRTGRYEASLICGKTEFAAGNSSCHTVVVPSLVRSISPVNDLKAFWYVYRALRNLRADIVHTHSSKAGFIGRWAAWLAGVRTIVHTPHGHVFYGYEFSSFTSFVYLMLERICVPVTDKLIGLTNGEMNESIGYGVGKAGQWAVIHSGVDYPALKPGTRERMRAAFGIQPTDIVVGTVARLEHVKGVTHLVDAAAGFCTRKTGPKVICLIVGDGKERSLIEKQIDELGIRNSVICTGMRNDVFELMSAMDIFVQPSLNEGMGKTIIQAQSVGLPIVGSRVQGIPDAMQENLTGLLVPPADPDALRKAVERLINDEQLRKHMSSAAAAWVNETIDGYGRFSVERMVHLLDKLYGSF